MEYCTKHDKNGYWGVDCPECKVENILKMSDKEIMENCNPEGVKEVDEIIKKTIAKYRSRNS